MQEFSVSHLVFGSGAFSIVIVGLLAATSFVSWGVILRKILLQRKTARANARFLAQFRKISHFAELQNLCKDEKEPCPLRAISKGMLVEASKLSGRVSYDNIHHRAELIEESAQRCVEIQRVVDAKYNGFLSVAANLSPFLGLLGTVWGIMDSLWSIGKHGSAELVVVAPGIGAALVTTIAGLLVAIPASGAFNLFSMRTNRNEVFYTNFGSHALAMFKRDELAAVESAQAKGTAE